MNAKPNLIEVLEIAMLKKEVDDLYAEIDRRVAKIKEEFGAGRFDYDLNNLAGGEIDALMFGKEMQENGRYFKFEIVDNLKKLEEDGSFWKSVVFKPFSLSSRSLKRCPKSLETN